MAKILFVETGIVVAGSWISLLNLTKTAVSAGHQVMFVVCSESLAIAAERIGVAYDYIPNPLLTIPENKWRRTWQRARNKAIMSVAQTAPLLNLRLEYGLCASTAATFKETLLKFNPDIVYANSQPRRDVLYMDVAKTSGHTCISHIRSDKSLGFTPLYAETINKSVDLIISNSIYTKKHWIAMGVRSESHIVQYNGVDVGLKLSPGEKIDRIVLPGRLVKWKGQEIAIRAVDRLRSHGYKIGLDIVGSGPDLGRLKHLVSRLHLHDSVTFLEFCKDLPAMLRRYRWAVIPSVNEPFGRVVIEAMQAGCIVVASNSGAFPEIIENGLNGFLFRSGCYESLATVLEAAISGTADIATITTNAYADILMRFDNSAIGEHWLTQLEQISRR